VFDPGRVVGSSEGMGVSLNEMTIEQLHRRFLVTLGNGVGSNFNDATQSRPLSRSCSGIVQGEG